MLSTIIHWTDSFNVPRHVTLKVGRIRGHAVADYKAILVDETSGNELTSGEIRGYPRWSEPVAGLIARALHYCIADGTPSHLRAVQSVRTLQVKVALVPGGRGKRRELVQFVADFRQMRTPVTCSDEDLAGLPETRDVLVGSDDPLHLALQCLSQWLWNGPIPRGSPTSPEVPVRRADDVSYVRLSDIPQSAQTVFRRRIQGATVPVIERETDIAYAGDWDAFLAGRR